MNGIGYSWSNGLGSPLDPAFTYPIYEDFTRKLVTPPQELSLELRQQLTSIGVPPQAFFVMTVGWGAAFYDPMTDHLIYVSGEPLKIYPDFSQAGMSPREMAHVLNVGRGTAAKMGYSVPPLVDEGLYSPWTAANVLPDPTRSTVIIPASASAPDVSYVQEVTAPQTNTSSSSQAISQSSTADVLAGEQTQTQAQMQTHDVAKVAGAGETNWLMIAALVAVALFIIKD